MFEWIAEVKPTLNPQVRDLCTRRYQNHPRGCPNYGKRDTCPPHAPLLYQIISPHYPIYLVWNIFDLHTHTETLRQKHPHWSWRQLSCCLYWQGKARKLLRQRVETFLERLERSTPQYRSLTLLSPEANGVDITDTMKRIGEELEWPPRTKTYQVALIGHQIEREEPCPH